MIGFVGLSHLGIVSSISIASKGFSVLAYDADESLTARLNAAELPLFEPGLDDLLKSSKKLIQFVSDASLLAKCDVIYIARDVPTDENNLSRIEPVIELFDLVLKVASPNCTIVILSQVSPGATRKLKDRADALSKNKKINLYYQVETLIFGNAVQRALEPERYIIGSHDPKATLPASYAALLEAFNCPILVMRFESAELAKISINMFLVSTVATTNMIAEVCEKIGASWSEISPALRLDKRIGKYAYLTPGLGIAGGNLERDLETINGLAKEHGADTALVATWQQQNTYRRDWVLRTLNTAVFSEIGNPVIAVLGLAYKAGTNSIKNSPSLAILEKIKNQSLKVFDPKVKLQSFEGKSLKQCSDCYETSQDADVLLIMTPWDEFKELDIKKIFSQMKGKNIIDPYAVFNAEECHKLGFRYFSLGTSF